MTFNTEKYLEKKGYSVYKQYLDSEYFAQFLEDIKSDELMEHIRFCNDVLHIPPVLTYIHYRRDLYSHTMEDSEKKALGTWFGFLYQYGDYAHLYGADSGVKICATDRTVGLSRAAYFKPIAGKFVPYKKA